MSTARGSIYHTISICAIVVPLLRQILKEPKQVPKEPKVDTFQKIYLVLANSVS
jgi:hypothetical protein